MALPNIPVSRRRELAEQVGVGEQYLYQVLRGLGVASPALARKLNAAEPALLLQDLRPDDWADFWPELAGAPCADQNQPAAPAYQARAATESVAQGAA